MSAFGQAHDATEKARREALEAMARSGSAGIDAYKEAQSQVSGYRDAAVSQALLAAAKRGASPEAQGALETTIRTPGDRTLQHLAAAQGTFAADIARRQGANATYFDQAKAAVPAIEAASARDISYARETLAKQAAKEKAAKDDARWQQVAISQGLAEMQAEADRTRRFNDVQEQQAYQRAPVSNPTFDPIGAALGGAEGRVAPEVVQRILANPMTGATYATPSGAVVPVTEGLADPHYMGHLLPDAASAIAEEIARARIPDDVQAQRDAYTAVYGDDPRTEALARGIFRPPTLAQDLSTAGNDSRARFFGEYGVLPTASQVQADVLGLDPFADRSGKPRMSPIDAAGRVSRTPEKVLGVVGTVRDAEGQPALDEDTGQPLTLNVYEAVAEWIADYLAEGYTPEQASERVRADLEEQLGRDYPAVRETARLVFGGR